MSTKAIVITVLLLILLGAGAYFAMRGPEANPNDYNPPVTNGNNGGNEEPEPVQNSMIRIDSPLPGAIVSSPLAITGEARGNWYFEATFPVKILDANGKVLGQHYAEAQGEWMTTEFVPFTSSLTFSTPTTETGTLVIEKSNPSGLPENAGEVRVPIRFSGSSATQTRTINLYFYDQNKDKDASGNIKCSADGLVAIERTIPRTNTPIQDAVRELLKGPTASERSSVPGTEFPLSGVTLSSASLSNGVLTLAFNDPQNSTSGGSCRIAILDAQIEATARQFGGVTSVRYSPSDIFQP
ncbi:MAG: GerMN domain-containing protein [Candidatus Zambryskibacteria bacterium]|nr:GerMN domain-containing protein [Candidatus Zambryskibacteria bacterium]